VQGEPVDGRAIAFFFDVSGAYHDVQGRHLPAEDGDQPGRGTGLRVAGERRARGWLRHRFD